MQDITYVDAFRVFAYNKLIKNHFTPTTTCDMLDTLRACHLVEGCARQQQHETPMQDSVLDNSST